MAMKDILTRCVIKKLRKEKILGKNDKFSFLAKETVPFNSYSNDLYEFDHNLKANVVDIYWGFIKKRREYSEVYVAVLSEHVAYITVINQEKINIYEKIIF